MLQAGHDARGVTHVQSAAARSPSSSLLPDTTSLLAFSISSNNSSNLAFAAGGILALGALGALGVVAGRLWRGRAYGREGASAAASSARASTSGRSRAATCGRKQPKRPNSRRSGHKPVPLHEPLQDAVESSSEDDDELEQLERFRESEELRRFRAA